MKVGIFTTRTLAPLHPRLEAFIRYFREKGISYDLIPPKKHFFCSRLNWKSLFFFDDYSVLKNRKKIKDYDLILINDLKYLPVARYGKGLKKPVIYETIDNNVSLRAYSLRKKIPLSGLFMNKITAHFSAKEIDYAMNCCERIIVNSRALQEYFNNKADLVYYYSPFEDTGILNNSSNSPGILYLGEFSEEKGALDILMLREDLKIPLFIFGNIRSEMIRDSMAKNTDVKYFGKLNQTELTMQIRDLSEKYFLLGASFIKPVHQSYATQEANKDIDYLALGIPIIGNHRKPTEEKIMSGCGVFGEDEPGLKRLLTDAEFRKELSSNCHQYYFRHYTKKNFRECMEKIFGNYVK